MPANPERIIGGPGRARISRVIGRESGVLSTVREPILWRSAQPRGRFPFNLKLFGIHYDNCQISAARAGLLSLGAAAHEPGESLYVRLGGASGVGAIADTLIDRVAADPQLGASFKDAKLDRIKRLLAEQICDLSGGPCRYSGDDMRQVHAGHHISQAEFYGMVATLREVLGERHV